MRCDRINAGSNPTYYPKMTYAVQNTYKLHVSPILTPRIMNLFVLRNVELIFWLTHIQFQVAKYNQIFNFYKTPHLLFCLAPNFFAPQSF